MTSGAGEHDSLGDPHPATDPARRPAMPTPTEPVVVDVPRLIAIGTGMWLIALVAVLAVPALHEGDRAWWPWSALAGAVLGGIGWVYVRRGRGNAADAHR